MEAFKLFPLYFLNVLILIKLLLMKYKNKIIVLSIINIFFLFKEIYSADFETGVYGSFSSGNLNIFDAGANFLVKSDFNKKISGKFYSEYSYNKALYNGKGDHLFISQYTGDISVTYYLNNLWSLSLAPRFSLGRYDYQEVEPEITFFYDSEAFGWKIFSSYGIEGYNYPGINERITVSNFNQGTEYSYYLNQKTDLSASAEIYSSDYSTTGGYSDMTLRGGIDYSVEQYYLGGGIFLGYDSSGYQTVGLDGSGGYYLKENISVDFSTDLSSSSVSTTSSGTTTQKGGGKQGSLSTGKKPSPVSTQTSYYTFYLYVGSTYYF